MNKDNFSFNPKGHVYTLDGKPLTGVTTVLSVIAKPLLIGWSARMAIEYVESVGELKDDTLNVVGWSRERELAMKAHSRKKDIAATQGTDTHAEIEEYVKGCIASYDGLAGQNPETAEDKPALHSFIRWAVENDIRFIESEKRMYSREWWLAGTADLVFEKGGQRFVGDVKTMKKIWDRVPFLQMAAYTKMLRETDEGEYHGTCIINIPKETKAVETVYSFDWEGDTKAFEAALTLYRSLQQEV